MTLFEFPEARSVVGERMELSCTTGGSTQVTAEEHDEMRQVTLEESVVGPGACEAPTLKPVQDDPIPEARWKDLCVKVHHGILSEGI